MTSLEAQETERAFIDAYELSGKLLKRSAAAMVALTERIEAGETPPETDTKKTAALLTSMAALFMKEQERVLDQQRKLSGGGCGGGSLDLDAAREEVERKLAVLRAAGGSDAVLG